MAVDEEKEIRRKKTSKIVEDKEKEKNEKKKKEKKYKNYTWKKIIY